MLESHRLAPVVEHGQDGAAVVHDHGRVPADLLAPGLCHRDRVQPRERQVLSQRLVGREASVLEHPRPQSRGLGGHRRDGHRGFVQQRRIHRRRGIVQG